jgi:Zn-finger nucleic acid-binding protein
MRCPRCPDVELTPPEASGASLSASTCARCGGGLVPEEGARRFLEEELGHTRSELMELAALVGGARIACPSCNSKMSPIQLRGAPVDVCFGCGALWVDRGELEQMSAGRYVLPAPPVVAATAPGSASALAPPPTKLVATHALVRLDQRPWIWRAVRRVSLGIGGVGLVLWLVGAIARTDLAWWASALVLGAVLSWRFAIDVHPRAARIVHWHGLLPPPRLEGGLELPADAVIVCRALRVAGRALRFMRIDIVDGDGRVLATVRHVLRSQRALAYASELGRQVGLPTRVDRHPVGDAPAPAAPPLLSAAHVAIAPDDDRPFATRQLRLLGHDGALLGSAIGEMKRRLRPTTLAEVMDEHFVVADAATAARVRLLPSTRGRERTTLVVDDQGRGLGHIRARRGWLWDDVTWWSAGRTRGARMRVAHQATSARLVDDWGRVRGHVEVHEAPPTRAARVVITVDGDAFPGSARWCVLAMGLHVSLLRAVVDHE